jgi:hypothetical protein
VPWIDRRAEGELQRLVASSRAVVVNGPRQSGKSALVRRSAGTSGTYLTLDDRTTLRAARLDPTGFLEGRSEPILIDEFQRGGDPLLLAIKAMIDRDDRRGQVVLAGSTRFLAEPRLSESLAGPVRFLDLWPLSQGEIDGGDDGLLDAAFAGVEQIRARRPSPLQRVDVARRIAVGGLPEAVLASHDRDRRDFFEGYVRTITQRDVSDIAGIRQLGELDELWRLVAARTSAEFVPASIAQAAGLPDATVRRYLALLETVFAFHRVNRFSANLSARVSGRQKVHMVDTGIATHLLRETPGRLADVNSSAFGPLLETFVVNELARQCTWAEQLIDLYHLRVHSGPEVDIVAVGPGGRVVGIEVKATASPDLDDARGLRWLADRVGERWLQGIIVCLVREPVRLTADVTAMPVPAVWSSTDR